MIIDDRARHELYRALETTLGTAEADTLMAHLPPVGWADVATKRDLDHLALQLRGEMSTLGHELRGEMATLGHELRHDLDRKFLEFKADITRNVMFANFTMMIATVMLVFGAARLGV